MDHEKPLLIRSRVKHFVQLALGSKNAKSQRNVVTSNADAAMEESLVDPEDTPVREAAVLKQGIEGAQQVSNQQDSPSVPLPGLAEGEAHETTEGGQVQSDTCLQEAQRVAAEVVIEREDIRANRVCTGHGAASTENTVQAPMDCLTSESKGPGPEMQQGLGSSWAQIQSPLMDSDSQPELPSTLNAAPSPDGDDHAGLLNRGDGIRESVLMSRVRALKSNMSVTVNRLDELDQAAGHSD